MRNYSYGKLPIGRVAVALSDFHGMYFSSWANQHCLDLSLAYVDV